MSAQGGWDLENLASGIGYLTQDLGVFRLPGADPLPISVGSVRDPRIGRVLLKDYVHIVHRKYCICCRTRALSLAVSLQTPAVSPNSLGDCSFAIPVADWLKCYFGGFRSRLLPAPSAIFLLVPQEVFRHHDLVFEAAGRQLAALILCGHDVQKEIERIHKTGRTTKINHCAQKHLYKKRNTS